MDKVQARGEARTSHPEPGRARRESGETGEENSLNAISTQAAHYPDGNPPEAVNPSPVEPPTEPIEPGRRRRAVGPLAGSGSAAARVYAHVKERLLDGSFPAARCSRRTSSPGGSAEPHAVRQVFVQLKAEGLLRALPQARRARRAGRRLRDRGRLEARLLVEEHCARRAATPGAPPLPPSSPTRSPPRNAIATGEGDARSGRANRLSTGRSSGGGNAILTAFDALRDRAHRRGLAGPRTRAMPSASSPSTAGSPTRSGAPTASRARARRGAPPHRARRHAGARDQ